VGVLARSPATVDAALAAVADHDDIADEYWLLHRQTPEYCEREARYEGRDPTEAAAHTAR
jgi:hypothetical protein